MVRGDGGGGGGGNVVMEGVNSVAVEGELVAYW